MQQVLLSKFFICGLLMGIVSFVNGQLLQKYHTNQAFGNPNPTFVLLDTFLDKYGIWLIFPLIFFVGGFSSLILAVLGELVGAFLGRMSCQRILPIFSSATYLPFGIAIACVIAILL